jgi:hypothetical protein
VGALGEGFNWPMLMRSRGPHHAHTNAQDDLYRRLRPTLVAKGCHIEGLLTRRRLLDG